MRRFAAAVLGLALVGACAFFLGKQGSSAPTTAPAPASSGPERAEPIVLAISIDGLNPDALDALGESRAPSLHRLVREGAATLNARTADELTITLPNHTGMLTGRGIGGPGGHAVTFNDDDGTTLMSTHGSYVPGMFDVAHDHGLKTAFLAEKEKFHFLMRSWDADHGGEDLVAEDNGRDKTDVDQVGPAASLVARTQSLLIDGETDLIFLHLAAPDTAGHASGWLGPAYLAAVQDADASLGRILSSIDDTPGLSERVTILLTSDHGGPQGHKQHDDLTLLANRRVPFIVWGAGADMGRDLYALNPGRADPGGDRVGYPGTQPVRNMDIANTALDLLGLDPIEGAMTTDWPGLVLR